MTLHKDVIGTYLARFAEAEATPHIAPATQHFEHVLVVPAFDEPADFLQTLFSRIPETTRSQTLTIIVANVPDHLDPTEDRVRRTRDLLALRIPGCIVVDRVNVPIPRKRGVGLARKIGADIALANIHAGRVARPLIFSTDADAILPARYFDAPSLAQAAAPTRARKSRKRHPENLIQTWLFPYEHRSSDAELQRRVDCYEAHMRWYVLGLRHAGSPYAFHALGSTIVVGAQLYAQVRGYPKRNAGEDFHLLAKAAKAAAVAVVDSDPIVLDARASTRVPFGTGPAIQQVPATSDDFTSYDWSVFDHLRSAIRHIDDPTFLPSPPAQAALAALGLAAVVDRLDRSQRHQWFDGLKTLRCIHELQTSFPDQPLMASLATRFPACKPKMHDYLAHLRQIELQNRALFGVPALAGGLSSTRYG